VLKIRFSIQNKGFKFCIIYGRKRIGKTTLIKEFTYQSQLELGNVDYVLNKIKQSFSEYASKTFEQLSIKFCLNLPRKEILYWLLQMSYKTVWIFISGKIKS